MRDLHTPPDERRGSASQAAATRRRLLQATAAAGATSIVGQVSAADATGTANDRVPDITISNPEPTSRQIQLTVTGETPSSRVQENIRLQPAENRAVETLPADLQTGTLRVTAGDGAVSTLDLDQADLGRESHELHLVLHENGLRLDTICRCWRSADGSFKLAGGRHE